MQNKEISADIKRKIYILFILLFILAIMEIVYREIQYLRLKSYTHNQNMLMVTTIKAQPSPKTEEITLPGYVTAWHDATIYARTDGYIQEWKADIGTKVKSGDLLALISAPEVNQELKQTEANLKTAEANLQLAIITAKRWTHLLKTQSVSEQETEEKISDAKAKEAIVLATRANRDRLRDLVSFQHVTAPFDGIVAARNTDVGRLINAGSSAPQALFRVVQTNPLRVYVLVPQNLASRIEPNLRAKLYFPQHPNKIYDAKFLDSAKAINPVTRTLQVQFTLENPNNELFAGSYVKANLILPTNPQFVRLPINTILFRADGLHVGSIDKNQRVILLPITIHRDFGDYVEISQGVKPNDTIIINPPDSLRNGQKVKVSETLNENAV